MRHTIELHTWDVNGPQLESQVASIVIIDPRRKSTRNTFCIGFKHLGGSLTESQNWEFDHINYRNHDAAPQAFSIPPVPVEKTVLEQLLRKRGSSLKILLKKYTQQIYQKPMY